jgi:2-keto-3-deoxy-L-rhamnonate aldolase RhmA
VNHNRVKDTLGGGGFAFGAMLFEFATAGISRVLAAAGAEFVIFDQEHTGWDIQTVKPLISNATASGIVPLVRVPATEAYLISAALDAGAMGVMVPMVEDALQARRIVSAAKYPPDGHRGFGLLYADQIGATTDDTVSYMHFCNREQILIALIETSAGVEQAAEISAVEGIDMLWIGQRDLTNSLGIPGDFQNPAYEQALEDVLHAAQVNGKAVGMTVADRADAIKLLERGFRCICYGDLWVYENALRSAIASLHKTIERGDESV